MLQKTRSTRAGGETNKGEFCRCTHKHYLCPRVGTGPENAFSGKHFNNRQNGKLVQFVVRAIGGDYTYVQPARSHPQIADRHAPGGGHLK